MLALVLQDPNFCEDADTSKEKYRQYLLERLRIPAGVVFGHGLVNLALIQVPNTFSEYTASIACASLDGVGVGVSAIPVHSVCEAGQ